MEHIKIHRTAINAERFIAYLHQLRKKNGDKPIALFQDQLSVHKEKTVKTFYKSLDITPIFNVSYSPELNPIEACFSQVKRHFCSERLNMLANFKEFDQNKVIRSSFTKVTPELVRNCAAKSLNLLKDFKEKN